MWHCRREEKDREGLRLVEEKSFFFFFFFFLVDQDMTMDG